MGSRVIDPQAAIPMADLPLDVEVIIDRREMTLSEVLSIKQGTILPVARTAIESARIQIGSVPFGYGEILGGREAARLRIIGFEEEAKQ